MNNLLNNKNNIDRNNRDKKKTLVYKTKKGIKKRKPKQTNIDKSSQLGGNENG